jgi:hypothetical protein
VGGNTAGDAVDLSRVGAPQDLSVQGDKTQVLVLPTGSDADRTQVVSAPAGSDPDRTQVVSMRVTQSDGDMTQVLPIPRQRGPVEDDVSLLDTHTTLFPRQAFIEGGRLPVARVPESMDHTSLLTRPVIAAPIFVDDSGRRRRLLVAVALVVAVLCLALIGLLWLSQLGSGAGLNLGSNLAAGVSLAAVPHLAPLAGAVDAGAVPAPSRG